MRKINKVINIAIIFTLIGALLCIIPEISFANTFLLRIPLLSTERRQALIESKEAEKELTLLIKQRKALESIQRESKKLTFGDILVNLTKYCDAQCRHCAYDSLPIPKDGNLLEGNRMSDRTVRKLLGFINEANPKKLTFTGYGEPFLEFDKILYLVANADVSELISIITNAKWAVDAAGTEKYLNELDKIMEQRNKKFNKPITLVLDVSIDQFHQERIPLDNALNIIWYFNNLKASGRLKYMMLRFQTLAPGEGLKDTFGELMGRLNIRGHRFEYEKGIPVRLGLTLDGGFEFFMEMRGLFFGSQRGEILAKRLSNYPRRDMIHLMSNYPYKEGGEDNRLDVKIDSEGELMPFDQTNKSLSIGNVNKNTVEEIKIRSLADPVIRAMRERGISYLWRLAQGIDPALNEKIRQRKDNDFRNTLRDILGTSEFRLSLARRIILDYGLAEDRMWYQLQTQSFQWLVSKILALYKCL